MAGRVGELDGFVDAAGEVGGFLQCGPFEGVRGGWAGDGCFEVCPQFLEAFFVVDDVERPDTEGSGDVILRRRLCLLAAFRHP